MPPCVKKKTKRKEKEERDKRRWQVHRRPYPVPPVESVSLGLLLVYLVERQPELSECRVFARRINCRGSTSRVPAIGGPTGNVAVRFRMYRDDVSVDSRLRVIRSNLQS